MSMSIVLPRSPERPAFDDLIEAWVAVEESVFRRRADALLADRAAAAAAAEQAAADEARRLAEEAAAATTLPGQTTTTTSSTTTTTIPLPPPEWHVDHDPIVRVGPASMVRLRETTVLDDVPQTSTSAFYALDDGPVVPSIALVDPARTGDLIGLVAERLGDRVGDWSDAAPWRLLTDVTVGDGGSLVVALATEFLAAGAAGDPVVIEPDTAAPLLSATGRAIAFGEPVPGDDGVVDCEQMACVALTFDDGPSRYTSHVLDVLARTNTRATFFVVGRSVAQHPELVAREVAEGHAVGNHSWSHPNFHDLAPADQVDQIGRTDAAIFEASGVIPPIFRPPYGAYDLETRYMGRALILWDVDSRDWDHRDPARTLAGVLEATRPGSIVLMHDLQASTAAVTPLLIAELRAAGFRLVTVPQLLGGVELGAAYRSRTDVEPPPPPTTTTTTPTTTTTTTTTAPTSPAG